MRRLFDILVWVVVIAAIAGTVYATSDTPPNGKIVHGRWVVGEHNPSRCRICFNGEIP